MNWARPHAASCALPQSGGQNEGFKESDRIAGPHAVQMAAALHDVEQTYVMNLSFPTLERFKKILESPEGEWLLRPIQGALVSAVYLEAEDRK
jgi:hypothetical protein